MAKTFKCDRCGVYYDSKDRFDEIVIIKIAPDAKHFDDKDLCLSCQNDFFGWWKHKNV